MGLGTAISSTFLFKDNTFTPLYTAYNVARTSDVTKIQSLCLQCST